ncbi:MAG: hypothetical protein U5K33_05145 [Halofilum sp. (in: g-proteobacteria)]|nr:hypothetical protein [Halofilum sp. (in: g-proteobacteria)]
MPLMVVSGHVIGRLEDHDHAVGIAAHESADDGRSFADHIGCGERKPIVLKVKINGPSDHIAIDRLEVASRP